MVGAPLKTAVPVFYLYGEPQRQVAEGFVHIESLDDRSRPSEWTIRPHLHDDLHHIILIIEGGGAMVAEGKSFAIEAPCFLLVPAGIVHGFTWTQESRGWVLTIAGSYLRHLLTHDPALNPLFLAPHAVTLEVTDLERIEDNLGRLIHELSWSRQGQRAAVEALLLLIMVMALRGMSIGSHIDRSVRRQAMIVARLRERIESRFREREPVHQLAHALGVSQTALRHACTIVAGTSPTAIVDERALLEARRLLLYSNMNIADIAYAIGFNDAAYFSRFFKRYCGQSPKQWREAQRKNSTA